MKRSFLASVAALALAAGSMVVFPTVGATQTAPAIGRICERHPNSG